MESSNIIDTLIDTATRLDMDKLGSPLNETMYRCIIGSLLYLTASRPDIAFCVGFCSRFQSSPKESQLKVANRILRYLKGMHDLVLYYHSGDNFNLIGMLMLIIIVIWWIGREYLVWHIFWGHVNFMYKETKFCSPLHCRS